MSESKPNISRLKLDDNVFTNKARIPNSAEAPSAVEKEGTPTPNTATTAPHSAASSGRATPAISFSPTPKTGSPHTGDPQFSGSAATPSSSVQTHLKPNGSSTSLSSQASTQSKKGHSILELKRFFGKGRTKHDQGVSPHKLRDSRPHEHKKPHFSLFGLGKKSKKSTPTNLTPAVSPHHHHHHHHDKHGSVPPHADTNNDFRKTVDNKYIDPRHLEPGKAQKDPNLVIHDPGYEGDWDPFHIFGLTANSESMPFLESGITKYGQLGKDMGSGAGGSVRMMARASDKKMFAVKEFRARRNNETPQKYAKHVTSEYALGAALHHKNIIETIDLLKEGDQYYEVMEYGPFDYFELVMGGQMSTMQINSAFKQIVNGVAYLHSMGVAHRDLKLDNCVVDQEGVVKLIDFGSAVIFKYPMSSQIHMARGIMGSDPYLAPEVFSKQPYQPQTADIWSCGIIYCCSYLRRFPWKIPQDSDVGYKRFSSNPANWDGTHPPESNSRKITGPWRLLRLLPFDVRDVIRRILTIDVNERITTNELTHTFWLQDTEEVNVLPKDMQK